MKPIFYSLEICHLKNLGGIAFRMKRRKKRNGLESLTQSHGAENA